MTCAWCPGFDSSKDATANESHGMCAECLKRELGEIESFVKDVARATDSQPPQETQIFCAWCPGFDFGAYHKQLDVSHGMCPACQDKMMAQFAALHPEGVK